MIILTLTIVGIALTILSLWTNVKIEILLQVVIIVGLYMIYLLKGHPDISYPKRMQNSNYISFK